MSGSAETIKDFLVSVGYVEHGRTQFTGGLNDATKQAVKLGASLKATAVAAKAALGLIASELEAVGFAAARAGGTIETIRAFGFAVGQLGGSAEQARGSVENLSRLLRTNPGNEGFLQSLGVQTRDANGRLRDTAALIRDAAQANKGRPYFQQYQIAQQLGIDESTWQAATAGADAFSKQYAEMMRAAGIDSAQAAGGAHAFMNELRLLGATLGVVRDKVGVSLFQEAGGDVRRFRDLIWYNFDAITKAIEWMARGLSAASGVVTSLVATAVRTVREVIDWFGRLDKSSQGLILTLGGLGAAWLLLNRKILATPTGRILALAAAFLALKSDYDAYAANGEHAVNWEKWEPELKAARKGFGDLGTAVRDLQTELSEHLLKTLGLMDDDGSGKSLGTRFIENFTRGTTRLIKLLTALAQIADAVLHGEWARAGGIAVGIVDHLNTFIEHRTDDGTIKQAQKEGEQAEAARHNNNPHGGAPADLQKARKEAYDQWIAMGYSPAGAAAKVADEDAESTFDPGLVGDGGKAEGSFQWHKPRRDAIREHTHIDVTKASAAEQRRALDLEGATGLDPQSAAVYQRIKNATDVNEAVRLSVTQVERPGDQPAAIEKRRQIAADVLRRFGPGALRPELATNPNYTDDLARRAARNARTRETNRNAAPTAQPTGYGHAAAGAGASSSMTNNITVNAPGAHPAAVPGIIDGVQRSTQQLIRLHQGVAR